MAEDIVAAENTDREIWRERDGDFYSDSIQVTKDGSIGINCSGFVFVKSVRDWHRLAHAEATRLRSAGVPDRQTIRQALKTVDCWIYRGGEDKVLDCVVELLAAAPEPAPADGVEGLAMKQFVQIINEQEMKAVRFPFDDHTTAEEFANDLNAVFSKHNVSSVVGRYNDGETCPFAEGRGDEVA